MPQHTTSTTASARLAALAPDFRALTLEAWREYGIDLRRADHCQPPEAAATLVAAWPAGVDALTWPAPSPAFPLTVLYGVHAPYAAVRREIDRAVRGAWDD